MNITNMRFMIYVYWNIKSMFNFAVHKTILMNDA